MCRQLTGVTLLWIPLLLLALFFAIRPGQVAHAQSFKPEQLRASFLYHIVHYTSYPEENFKDNKVNFCFFEKDDKPHTQVFKSLPKKKLKNRDVQLVEINSIDELDNHQCQLIFVGKQAENNDLFAKLAELNNEVVSVGETRDFIERGGMVTIVPLQSKMKIFFSQKQYENTSLKFSSLLLKRANFR